MFSKLGGQNVAKVGRVKPETSKVALAKQASPGLEPPKRDTSKTILPPASAPPASPKQTDEGLLVADAEPGANVSECKDNRVELGARLFNEGRFAEAVRELQTYTKGIHAAPKEQPKEICLFKANLYMSMASLGVGREKDAREYLKNGVKVAGCKPLDHDVPSKVKSLYDEVCEVSEVSAQRPGMEFVFVKGGCFDMGGTFGDAQDIEKPVHRVCVGDFSLGKYEVTQGQWKAIMGSNPSHFSSCGDSCPVEMVSWKDAQEFIRKLNEKTGQRYRLPTEAEWEYACRGGGREEKYTGTSDDSSIGDYAWYVANSGLTTHPVGQKKPNSLGLYDMTGNVWEWVQDWYGAYSSSSEDNPQGPSSGWHRVIRGGSWNYDPRYIRCGYRSTDDPSNRFYSLGFRLLRTQ